MRENALNEVKARCKPWPFRFLAATGQLQW